eukprot:4637877-Prymnesium_polylepis.1
MSLHRSRAEAPRVALCITGAPRMNPDALPAMARHVRSHVIRPWRADVFVGIEILGTSAESAMLGAAVGVLRPKAVKVYCPLMGCHQNLTLWCRSPGCEVLPAHKPIGPPHIQMHCGQRLRQRPSFELMSVKREECYRDIVNYEASVQAGSSMPSRTEGLWQYNFVAYARPDLWYATPRRRQELFLLDNMHGIWINGGDCAGKYTKRPPAECMEERDKESTCTSASDHMAVMRRHWAPSYFSAAQLITQIRVNSSFGCKDFFGAASGICECAKARIMGMSSECMLSSWLVGQSVPYARYPWKTVFAWGLDGRGLVTVDARSGMITEMEKNGEIPGHCELVKSGSYESRHNLDKALFGSHKARL